MRITRRTLEREEVARAIEAGGPLRELGADPDKLSSMAIAVVEVDGVIVAYWVAWMGLHLEPLWIDPRWRRHPGVVGGIIDQMELVVQATGEPCGFCVVQTDDLESVAPYAKRLGFHEAPGKLYYLVVQEPAPPPVGV